MIKIEENYRIITYKNAIVAKFPFGHGERVMFDLTNEERKLIKEAKGEDKHKIVKEIITDGIRRVEEMLNE
jgi:hypothetical protein